MPVDWSPFSSVKSNGSNCLWCGHPPVGKMAVCSPWLLIPASCRCNHEGFQSYTSGLHSWPLWACMELQVQPEIRFIFSLEYLHNSNYVRLSSTFSQFQLCQCIPWEQQVTVQVKVTAAHLPPGWRFVWGAQLSALALLGASGVDPSGWENFQLYLLKRNEGGKQL